MIREQNPLKQGLKLRDAQNNGIYLKIREQDPLKQGLKQDMWQALTCPRPDSRARSTKTRIETELDKMFQDPLFKIREQDPLKQGLKHHYRRSACKY